MQTDPEHYDPRKFESITRRCTCTGTSNAAVNLRRCIQEDWFFQEKLAERIINSCGQKFHQRSTKFLRNPPYSAGNVDSSKKRHDEKNNVENKRNGQVDYRISRDNCKIIIDRRGGGDKRERLGSLPMRRSLFPCVPPYVLFHAHNCKCSGNLPRDLASLLKWKLTASTPKVVTKILMNSGYQLVTKGNEWSAVWNLPVNDLSKQQRLKAFQKVNSFPGSLNLGSKDTLWEHLSDMMKKYGAEIFDFMPRTYVLPRDIQKLENAWRKRETGNTWIVKPPSSGRGQGVRVINQWWEIPKWHSVIVQRYISKPRLVNGSKFDLRIYVLLTSVNPTRIYIYEEGLVRFASVRYVRGSTNLNDRYMHLTNSSVNKRNPSYVTNDSVNSSRGHKWSLRSLWSQLRKEGVDVADLWSKIKDIVVKTIIAAEASLNAAIWEKRTTCYTYYELFGFDVLLDENHKPWLLEVNVLPSLQTDSPLDLDIKGSLVKNVLNIAGYRIPEVERASGGKFNLYGAIFHDQRLYDTSLNRREKTKQSKINEIQCRERYLKEIINDLTRDDLRQLVRYEDELSQAGNFKRIFPTERTHMYLKFFVVTRYYDKLLDAWEHRYSDDRQAGIKRLTKLCEIMQHFEENDVETDAQLPSG